MIEFSQRIVMAPKAGGFSPTRSLSNFFQNPACCVPLPLLWFGLSWSPISPSPAEFLTFLRLVTRSAWFFSPLEPFPLDYGIEFCFLNWFLLPSSIAAFDVVFSSFPLRLFYSSPFFLSLSQVEIRLYPRKWLHCAFSKIHPLPRSSFLFFFPLASRFLDVGIPHFLFYCR